MTRDVHPPSPGRYARARPDERERGGADSAAGRAPRGERSRTKALEERLRALSRPEAYPRHVEEVERLQTHAAVLFFAGDRVYKLEKPVRLELVDPCRVEDRRRACEEEVRLNRRLSPSIYLGVLPVTREDDGWIVIDGSGEPIDWVVERVRLPADRKLDSLLGRDEVDEEDLERVARVLARFHARAMTGPEINRSGLVRAVARSRAGELEQLADRLGDGDGILGPEARDYLAGRTRRFLAQHRELLERRVADWRIREGHGDLRAGNICLIGQDVFVVDCVELDRDLRCGDVASDLASLTMDLEHRGHVEAAGQLLQRYAELAEDLDLATLVPFYAIDKALIRVKAELLTAEDESQGAERRTAAHREARRYAQLALGYALPHGLVLVGWSAPDRERTARYVAGRFRARRYRTDDGDALERAAEDLQAGRTAVIDGGFARREDRLPFLDLATRLGSPVHLLGPSAPGSGAATPAGAEIHRVEPPDADPTPEGCCAALQRHWIAVAPV